MTRGMTGDPPLDVVLLAAGSSTRMGAENKLLLAYGRSSVLRSVAEALLETAPRSLIVVLGHEAERVRTSLDGLGVDFVENPDHAQGQMSSVRAGCRAVRPGGAGTLVALGDMPALTARHYRALSAAFFQAGGDRILVPLVGGQRGNPIVLPPAQTAQVAEGALNAGCRRLIERHPELVEAFELGDPAFLADIDTPAAYSAALAATENQGARLNNAV